MPIYKVSMEEARRGAVCPGTFLLVLMFRVKCSHFRAKVAQFFSGHLPGGIAIGTSSGRGSSMLRGENEQQLVRGRRAKEGVEVYQDLRCKLRGAGGMIDSPGIIRENERIGC
jgi:hypothetical protein